MATATMVRKSQRRRKPTSIAASALVALGASDEDDMATAQAAGQGSAVPSVRQRRSILPSPPRSSRNFYSCLYICNITTTVGGKMCVVESVDPLISQTTIAGGDSQS
mmetsp:Transcript_7539/g.15142  ORF Transcript_7539/g.15142 Transcript_7539/m.15142 type:complete len:107 (-) Transcript_7539:2022-2342(-)